MEINNKNSQYLNFLHRLYENIKKVLLFMMILMFGSFLSKSIWLALAVLIILKVPVGIKRSKFFLVSLVEYKDNYRFIYLIYGKTYSTLVNKTDLAIRIDQFQSYDAGFYLSIYANKKHLFSVSDSCGWYITDFLRIYKNHHKKLPNGWIFQEKAVINYMKRNHPNIEFDISVLNP